MHKATSEDMDLLEKFLASSYSKGDAGVYSVCPRKDVTIVMYFFWRDDIAFSKWPNFVGALLETWRNCGLLPTVIVTNVYINAFRILQQYIRMLMYRLRKSFAQGISIL